MHDFLLAKEIIDSILAIAKEKKLKNIKSVSVEIGSIALAHDNLEEHLEEISLDNLQFGLKNLVQNTILKDVQFKLSRITGESWKITNIEIE